MCKDKYGGHKILEAFLATGSLAWASDTRMITRPAQKRPARNMCEHITGDRPPVKKQSREQKQRQRDKRAWRNIADMDAGFYVDMNDWDRARAMKMRKDHEEAKEGVRQMYAGMYVKFPTHGAKRRALEMWRDQHEMWRDQRSA